MEVKINKEIRDYSENVYFGLSLRQFVCSFIGIINAVIIYLLFKNKLGMEVTSWLCMFCAFPFILLGFIKYNGMNMENLIQVIIKNKIMTPKYLKFKSINYYNELLKNKEVKKVENIKRIVN